MFLIGFLCGVAFMVLIVAIGLSYTSHRQSKELLKHTEIVVGVSDEDIKNIIRSKRSVFTKLDKFGLETHAKMLKENSIGVIREIAHKYCPDAKYPLYELTLEEALLLNIHISERLLRNLEDKKLEVFKKLKLSKILELNDFKNKIQNNPLYAKAEKYRLLSLISKGWMVLNLANPKYWIKKIFFDGALEVAYRSLGVIIINTIGAETHNIYSRKFKNSKD